MLRRYAWSGRTIRMMVDPVTGGRFALIEEGGEEVDTHWVDHVVRTGKAKPIG